MKRLLTLSIGCILAMGFFSCKNSVEIVKRHYNTGYYISHNNGTKAKSKEQHAVAKEPTTTLAAIPVKTIREKQNAPELTASINTTNAQAAAPASHAKKAAAKSVDEALSVSSAMAKKSFAKGTKHSNALKAAGRGEESTGMMIILTILCFFPFLCLIPVYRHDGRITLNFWLTLILHLTFIGYIIYSLLVLYNIVDLS